MGSRIKINLLILFCLLISCKVYKPNENKEEEYFVLAYKKSVAYGCINTATNGNFQNMLTNNNDLGLFTESGILFQSTVNNAKKKGAEHVDKLEPINYADAEGRLPIFSGCLSYAFSKEIDSIAHVEYKKYLKERN